MTVSPGRRFMIDLLVSSLMADGGLESALNAAITAEIQVSMFYSSVVSSFIHPHIYKTQQSPAHRRNFTIHEGNSHTALPHISRILSIRKISPMSLIAWMFWNVTLQLFLCVPTQGHRSKEGGPKREGD